jgi:glycosyltransferase involved in cell wall biosynthesis
MNIALISPAKEAYSETFIKAHKEQISGNIFYLYGGFVPLWSENGEYFARPLPRWKRWTQSLLIRLKLAKYESPQYFYLKRYLKKHKIQVILAEYGQTGAEMMPLCQSLNIPLVVHFHGYDAYSSQVLDLYQVKYKALFKFASAIIVVSKDMQKQLLLLGASEHKLILNPYNCHPSFYEVLPNYESNQFLAVGRFVNKKAPYLTLWAFRSLHQQQPNATLVMIGEGELLETCQNLAKQWGLTEAVTFMGKQNPSKVREMMSKSFCFLQHSITASNGDKEGTPVAILEASAAGLPVIATFHAGIPEAVIHQKTGFLVPEQGVEMMSEYMIQLYQDRVLVKKMGEDSRKHSQAYYTQHIQKLNLILAQTVITHA